MLNAKSLTHSVPLCSSPLIFIGEKFCEGVKIPSVRKLNTRAVSARNASNIADICIASVEANYAQLTIRCNQVFKRNVWRKQEI